MRNSVGSCALQRTTSNSSFSGDRRRSWRRTAALAAAAALAVAATRRAAAQATWNGGIGNWNSPGNWSTGVVPNSGTTSVFIDGGKVGASIVNLDLTATINALTIDSGDTLSFASGTGLTLNGGATV